MSADLILALRSRLQDLVDAAVAADAILETSASLPVFPLALAAAKINRAVCIVERTRDDIDGLAGHLALRVRPDGGDRDVIFDG